MTKYIEEAKVIGQWVLNAVTRELDMIAPKIAAEAVPGQFVNVQAWCVWSTGLWVKRRTFWVTSAMETGLA